MRYLSIDDEAIAHTVINAHCREIGGMQCIANCASVDEALNVLLEVPVDLILLDVEMPMRNGFQLLRRLPEPPLVIIVSAHREYALEGYEFEACDYLLKPFSRARFRQSIEKVSARLGARAPARSAARSADPALVVRDEKGRRRLAFDEIVYIEACRNYSCIHTIDGEVVVTEKISALAEALPHTSFVRTHRSYIVAISRITRINATSVTLGTTELPVGRTFKPRLQALTRRSGHASIEKAGCDAGV